MHTFTLATEPFDKASIQNITDFLKTFHPPVLRNVTVQFRVAGKKPWHAWHKKDDDYIDACLKFEAALSKFPRHRLSLSGSSMFYARRHLWMRELGSLFPTFHGEDRLTIDCDPCESPD